MLLKYIKKGYIIYKEAKGLGFAVLLLIMSGFFGGFYG
jgi:hypothetical protein